MGQEEVLKVLRRNKEGMTAEEIVQKTKTNGRVVGRALMVMHRFQEVSRESCKESSHFKYIYKAI